MNGASAFRILEQPESSFELVLADLNLPADTTGSVTFKMCATCRIFSRRLTDSTRYYVNGAQLPYADFVAAAAALQEAASPTELLFAGVFVDNETQRVTRIVVRSPAPPPSGQTR
jgi:hypothetical protein